MSSFAFADLLDLRSSPTVSPSDLVSPRRNRVWPIRNTLCRRFCYAGNGQTSKNVLLVDQVGVEPTSEKTFDQKVLRQFFCGYDQSILILHTNSNTVQQLLFTPNRFALANVVVFVSDFNRLFNAATIIDFSWHFCDLVQDLPPATNSPAGVSSTLHFAIW